MANERERIWPAWALLGFLALLGIYFTGRYGGQWAEVDSSEFARYIRAMVASGQLVPPNGEAYGNGYAGPAIGTFLVAMTGLDVATLQQIAYPMLAALVVLPAWAAYRELTNSARGATIATAILLTQPEFLFVVLRSSHEKFTRTLMFVCLLLLARSFRLRSQPGLFACHVGLFYLAAFGLITSNNLLAHSFIVAVASALALGWLMDWREKSTDRHLSSRLASIALVCLGLTYVFTFYAYPPARSNVQVLQSLGDRIASLFLDVQQPSTNAYAQVNTGWISLPVYFVLSAANWLLLLISGWLAVRRWWRWLFERDGPRTLHERLILLFYAAFAIQGVASVIVDASGALGSNLQHRLFPSVSMLAAALVASRLAEWQPRRFGTPLRAGIAMVVALVALLGVLKATNEPLLSNKWTFYRSSEVAALNWSEQNQQNATIWGAFDERLTVMWATLHGDSASGNTVRGFALRDSVRDLLISDLTRMQSVRLGLPIPLPPDALRIYDNGETQLFHLLPATLYQR